jgi:hypothetical protein
VRAGSLNLRALTVDTHPKVEAYHRNRWRRESDHPARSRRTSRSWYALARLPGVGPLLMQPISTMAVALLRHLTAGKRACPIGESAPAHREAFGAAATREHAAPE